MNNLTISTPPLAAKDAATMARSAAMNDAATMARPVVATYSREAAVEAYGRIVNDMEELLHHSPSEGLVWLSNRTDLMEMIYMLYEQESVRDADGKAMAFTALLRRFCAILHQTYPCNPYSYLRSASRRKGFKVMPLLQRYQGLPIGRHHTEAPKPISTER